MANGFHNLRVVHLHRPVADALTITLEVPSGLQGVFAYRPGQHLVFRLQLQGAEQRRSYSLNSCPGVEQHLSVTVKRVKDGLVSNQLNDYLRVGDTLEVMAPTGRFSLETDARKYRTVFLFAAGSGITPVYSMLKAVLHQEPYSSVVLFYGNRNKSSIIFREELEQLRNQFADRLQLAYTFSEPYSDWSSMWEWKLRKGIIDAEAVEWFITNFPPRSNTTEYYICGPGNMNQVVRTALMDLGIEPEQIHFEQFGVGGDVEVPDIPGPERASLTAHLQGQVHSLEVQKGQTLLQALKENGADPPYSCESGTCGTCVAKVKRGQVKMRHCFALEDKEIADGMVLTCQAIPQTENVEITF